MMVEIKLRVGLYYNCNKNTSVVFMMNETEVTTMKKSSYFALVMGTVSGVMFALGMCMALVEEWAMLKGGVILGGAGLLLGLVTLLILGIATVVIFVKHQDNLVRIRNKTEIGLMSTIKGENRMK